jgi:hypothetical protein
MTQLPEHNNEPLRLADGRLVYPGGDIDSPVGPAPRLVEVPTHREAQQLVVRMRRKVADLPAVPKQMNAVGAILAYVMFGLDDEEVALATHLSTEQVGNIKASDPYKQMHDAVVRTVLDSEAGVVRELIAKNARRAAETMVDALNAGTRSDRMSAARDILDRSGHRPADVVEHRHRMDGELVIEIVKRDDGKHAPTIDMGVI